MDYFNSSQQFEGHLSAGQLSPLEEKSNPSIAQTNIPTATPPQKRRRGRPPKCPSSSDGHPSPAAHLSAAVVKQGTPKASAPLMRISPLRGKRSSDSNSSPTQRPLINPSPKGGLLMTLDNGQQKPASKKAKRSGSTSSASTIFSMTVSEDPVKKSSQKNSSDTFLTPTKISMTTQENIHSLTSDSPFTKGIKTSVNPSLLLSSPMPNTHGFNQNKKLDGETKPLSKKKAANKLKAKSQSTFLSSSPATPNSLSSSCFSSIMQSSPLYHGYYANQSSPSNPLTSSPIKFQMKPIDLPELKKESRKIDLSLPKIDELPKNPFNSPNLKAQDPSTSPTKGEFKLSFSIDETGQAQVTTIKASKSKEPNMIRPKFTRHESLMNISQNPYQLMRTGSLSNIPQVKIQPSISSVLEEQSSSQDIEMFIEPSKMSTDPLISEFNQTVDLENLQNSENSSLMADDENLDDMNYDARKALIKMMRRSI